MRGYKNILLVVMTAGVIFGLSCAAIVKEPDGYIESERRLPARMPELTIDSLRSGDYMEGFEAYAVDQFPQRDSFRAIKAFSARRIFRKRDDNGLYIADGYLSQLRYPVSGERIDRTADALRQVYDMYLAGTDCEVYLSIIPDKNYFLAPAHGYPAADYPAAVRHICERLDFARYADIFGTLGIGDYYRTDTHWRQERLIPTAQRLAAAMGADIGERYEDNALGIPFYGVYYGQAMVSLPPDSLHYLTSDTTDRCIVTSCDTGSPSPGVVYDTDKAAGRDGYDLYLSGANALLTMDMPDAATERELVIFRDSFGSSIAPLLAPGYSRVTLVDLRYIRYDAVGDYISFSDQDVLFLYSTMSFFAANFR